MSFVGQRPKFNTIKYTPRSSDPVNPVEGEVQFSDGTARPKGLWQYKDGDWAKVSDSGTKDNYIYNSDFEVGTEDWFTFDDGASYADGTGGSPSAITIASNSTTPLADTKDLRINKAAVSAVGEGVSVESLTINREDLGKKLFLSLSYDFTAANYISGDVQLKAYDMTNSQILTVFPVGGLDDSAGLMKIKSKATAFIAPPSNCTQVRISLYANTDGASGVTWSGYIDSVELKADTVIPGAIITDEVSYTPNITWTTNATATARWHRVGNRMHVNGYVDVTGAPSPAVGLTVSLPSGYSIDTTKIVATQNENHLGNFHIWGGGTIRTLGKISYWTDTTLTFLAEPGGAAAANNLLSTVTPTFPATFASGDKVYFKFDVPISGWTASAALSTTDIGLQSLRLEVHGVVTNSFSSAAYAYNLLRYPTVEVDSHGIYNASTGVITIPKTGYYLLNAAVAYSLSGAAVAGSDQILGMYVNSVDKRQLQHLNGNGADTLFNLVGGSWFGRLLKGDQVQVYQRKQGTETITAAVDSRTNYLSLIEVPDLNIYSVFNQAESLTASSSIFRLDTAGYATSEYAAMTGNSVSLSPGTWILDGMLHILDQGVNHAIGAVRVYWRSANGANDAILPAAPVGMNPSGHNGAYEIQHFPVASIPSNHAIPVLPVIINVTSPTTIYLVPRVDFTTAGDCGLRTSIRALRYQ